MQDDGSFEVSLGNIKICFKLWKTLKAWRYNSLVQSMASMNEGFGFYFFFREKNMPGDKFYNLNNLKILITSRLPVFSNDFGQWVKKWIA